MDPCIVNDTMIIPILAYRENINSNKYVTLAIASKSATISSKSNSIMTCYKNQ